MSTVCVGFKKYLWIEWRLFLFFFSYYYYFFYLQIFPLFYGKTLPEENAHWLDITVWRSCTELFCVFVWVRGQLFPCGWSTLLCSTAEGPAVGAVVLVLLPAALIHGSESSDAPVVVVAVIVTWIIWSRWMSRIRVLRRSRDAWVSRCWPKRRSFCSMHFCWEQI